MHLPRLLPLLAVLAGCSGAYPAGMSAANVPVAGAAGDRPLLVVRSREPGVTATGAITAAVGGGLGAMPLPTASAARPAASPAPSPVATARRLESETFFLDVPGGWTVERQARSPEAATLRASYAEAEATITTTPGTKTLRERQLVEEALTMPALQYSQAFALDRVAGFVVAGTRERAGVKGFVTVYGAIYREQFYAVTTRWDKRIPEADQVERDVKAMLTSFRWL